MVINKWYDQSRRGRDVTLDLLQAHFVGSMSASSRWVELTAEEEARVRFRVSNAKFIEFATTDNLLVAVGGIHGCTDGSRSSGRSPLSSLLQLILPVSPSVYSAGLPVKPHTHAFAEVFRLDNDFSPLKSVGSSGIWLAQQVRIVGPFAAVSTTRM